MSPKNLDSVKLSSLFWHTSCDEEKEFYDIELNFIKLFMDTIYKSKVLVPGKPFQPNLMFASKP